MSSIRHEKKLVRKEVKHILSKLDSQEMERQSERVTDRVLNELKVLDNAHALTLFISCGRLKEVDTTKLLERALGEDGLPNKKEKKVFLPRVLDSDSNMHFLRTRAGDEYDIVPPFGIHEPKLYLPDGQKREDILESEVPLDVIFMPGLAFTKEGHRLGRGGGYYDSFIEKYLAHARERGWAKKPLLIALAFDEQVVDVIPTDSHDQPVDILVTPSKVYM